MSEQTKLRNPLSKLKMSLRALRERHEERHRPSGFGFALGDRVDYLNRQCWDELTRNGSIFMSRDVLRVIEQHGPENIIPRYALMFREEKPVAAMAVQIVSITGKELSRDAEIARANPSKNILR